MGLFDRLMGKKTTDIGAEIEKRAYMTEQLKYREEIGREKARVEHNARKKEIRAGKTHQESGGSFLSGMIGNNAYVREMERQSKRKR
jgi:hypothetical protein